MEALRPPMEQCRGADAVWLGLKRHTVLGLDVFQLVDAGEMAVDERRIGQRIGQRPQVLRWLEFWGIGWQEVERDVIGHAQAEAGVPSRPIQDQDDLLPGASSRLASKGSYLCFKQRDAHRRGEMKEGAARRGMDKADEIAPFIAVLDCSDGPLSLRRPDPAQDRQDRFEADAVFIAGPDLHRRPWSRCNRINCTTRQTTMALQPQELSSMHHDACIHGAHSLVLGKNYQWIDVQLADLWIALSEPTYAYERVNQGLSVGWRCAT